MKIFLTGGTGFIGSALLPLLVESGHEVRALSRSLASAAALDAAGATPVPGELTDLDLLSTEAGAAEAIIHLGSPGDATSGDVDAALAAAIAPPAAGKPWLYTGGFWVHGNTDGVVEDETTAPFAPPPITAWRVAVEERVRATGGIVIAPGIVHGYGGGLPAMVVGGPQSDGTLLFPGHGDQHWTTIHVDDCAALYLAALSAQPGSYYAAVSGDNPTVRTIAEAAARVIGLEGRAAPEPESATAARLGPLTEAFLLDQQASGARARRDLRWEPKGPTLVADIAGTYSAPPQA